MSVIADHSISASLHVPGCLLHSQNSAFLVLTETSTRNALEPDLSKTLVQNSEITFHLASGKSKASKPLDLLNTHLLSTRPVPPITPSRFGWLGITYKWSLSFPPSLSLFGWLGITYKWSLSLFPPLSLHFCSAPQARASNYGVNAALYKWISTLYKKCQ